MRLCMFWRWFGMCIVLFVLFVRCLFGIGFFIWRRVCFIVSEIMRRCLVWNVMVVILRLMLGIVFWRCWVLVGMIFVLFVWYVRLIWKERFFILRRIGFFVRVMFFFMCEFFLFIVVVVVLELWFGIFG